MSGYDCICICMYACVIGAATRSSRCGGGMWIKFNELYLLTTYIELSLYSFSSLFFFYVYKIRRVVIVKHFECVCICWTRKGKEILFLVSFFFFFWRARKNERERSKYKIMFRFLSLSFIPSILSLSFSLCQVYNTTSVCLMSYIIYGTI
jgi:hypothetical protein